MLLLADPQRPHSCPTSPRQGYIVIKTLQLQNQQRLVTAVAWSGRLLAACGDDFKAWVYDGDQAGRREGLDFRE